MKLEMYLATIVNMKLKANNIYQNIQNVPTGDIETIFSGLGLDSTYNAVQVAQTEIPPIYDGYGINPYVELADKIRLEIGMEEMLSGMKNGESDSTAIALVNEFRAAQTKYEEARSKITNILFEDRYKAKFEQINNDADRIVERLQDYFNIVGGTV